MRWPREFLDRVDKAAWLQKQSRTEYLKKAALLRLTGRGHLNKKEQLLFDFEQFANWRFTSPHYTEQDKEFFMKLVRNYIEESSL